MDTIAVQWYHHQHANVNISNTIKFTAGGEHKTLLVSFLLGRTEKLHQYPKGCRQLFTKFFIHAYNTDRIQDGDSKT